MQPLRGIVFKVMSVCMFMGMASLVKAASADVPPGQAVFFRSFFALPVILGWLAIRHELRSGWKTKNPMGHFWRGLVGTSAMGLGFTGLGLLPLPEVTAIRFVTPIAMVVLAALILGERFRLVRIAVNNLAGIPSIAASSRSETQSPVLPLPVIPTQTAWVVRSLAS